MKTLFFYPASIMLFLLMISCSSPVEPGTSIQTTNITFMLVEESHVSIWVENAYKTRVIDVRDEPMQAGQYSISVSFTDSDGVPLPAGIYTIISQTDQQTVKRSHLLSY